MISAQYENTQHADHTFPGLDALEENWPFVQSLKLVFHFFQYSF